MEIYINIPEFCPFCNSKTIIRTSDSGVKTLWCSNEDCSSKLINRLDHFCGKKGLDIKGFSKATIEKLINWGWISNFVDIFELKKYRNEWIQKPGFGIKSVDKILEAIETSRECKLEAFIAALGIPLIGTTASKELVKYFPDWDSFINAVESNYKFWDIPNFGGEMHNAIIKFNYTEAKKLINLYLNIINYTNKNINNDIDLLNGLVFVITGKLNEFKNRDELKLLIEKYGGKVSGSISSKTNYLINNDIKSNSSKNISAKKLNIPIISEKDFLKYFKIKI